LFIIKSKNAQISIEFILSLLILLIIILLFLKTNISFKNKLETKINYNNYNESVCVLKNIYLDQKEGVIINDSCKTYRERTSNCS
jgi:uncharacterized protein (UPF0333 family)